MNWYYAIHNMYVVDSEIYTKHYYKYIRYVLWSKKHYHIIFSKSSQKQTDFKTNRF